MTPNLFLLPAVASLGALGVVPKVADLRQCRPEAVNAFLFIGAAAAMLVF